MLQQLESLPGGAIGALVLAAVPVLLYLAYRSLYYYRLERFKGYPQLPPSLIWGHLKALGEIMQRGPPGRDGDALFKEAYQMLGKPPIMLFDLWPMERAPMLVITSHEVAEQVSRPSKMFPWSVPKSPTMGTLTPLVGGHSVLLLGGEDWKSLRRRFNPGFSPQHLMGLLPCILDKTQYYLRHLDDYCESGEKFRLETLLVNLTFDIIGAVVMDVDLNAQESKDRKGELITIYGDMLQLYTAGGMTQILRDPLQPLKRRWLGYRLNRVLRRIVRSKFEALKEQRRLGKDDGGAADHASGNGNASATASRNITALSLQDLDELDEFTLQSTCDQIKTFLLAGHDTTSILLQWCAYEFTRSPDVKARLIAELDDIFGPDPDPAVVRAQLLARGEELVRRMTYTSAVVKELLRMYAPAGTARMAPPGSNFTVKLPGGQGEEVRVDGMIMYNCANIIQRDTAIYGENADIFRPERWLGDADTSMATNADDAGAGAGSGGAGRKGSSVPPSAWRPFERGPRNCIGQELANIEARVILACCVRRYDFVKVGLGELDLDDQGQPVMNEHRQYKVKSEMYSMRQITPKPIDGTVVRVHLSDRAKAAMAK